MAPFYQLLPEDNNGMESEVLRGAPSARTSGRRELLFLTLRSERSEPRRVSD
jgi:hypothetical protein